MQRPGCSSQRVGEGEVGRQCTGSGAVSCEVDFLVAKDEDEMRVGGDGVLEGCGEGAARSSGFAVVGSIRMEHQPSSRAARKRDAPYNFQSSLASKIVGNVPLHRIPSDVSSANKVENRLLSISRTHSTLLDLHILSQSLKLPAMALPFLDRLEPKARHVPWHDLPSRIHRFRPNPLLRSL